MGRLIRSKFNCIFLKQTYRITQNERLVKKYTSELGRAKISLLGNDLTDT